MILLIAAVLAIALLLVTKMQDMAQNGANAMEENANKIFDQINDTSMSRAIQTQDIPIMRLFERCEHESPSLT